MIGELSRAKNRVESGKPLLYIGADPGGSGAFAVLDAVTAAIQTFAFQTVKARGRGRELVWAPACDWLDETAPTYLRAHAIIEKVGARPGNGGSSMFKFGAGAGAIQGIMAQRRTPVTYVTPAVWKAHFKLLGRDKGASRARACELFPMYARLFARAKDDGVAEAALLAKYGYDKGLA